MSNNDRLIIRYEYNMNTKYNVKCQQVYGILWKHRFLLLLLFGSLEFNVQTEMKQRRMNVKAIFQVVVDVAGNVPIMMINN
ncbi:hypothetical protein BLOT_013855 [Blomia tropicalis]|nr:hypothetical protein BLOT_013855 [Blomia tropicalis]